MDNEIKFALEQVERNQSSLQSAMNQIIKDEDGEAREKYEEFMKELVSHQYSRLAAYSNIIILVGYAVFFTVWSALKNDLPELVIFSSVLLMTLSVMIFILFEIFKMFSAQKLFSKQLEIFETEPDLAIAVKSAENLSNEFNVKIFKIWGKIFKPTVAFGVIAGLIFIISFIVEIFNIIL